MRLTVAALLALVLFSAVNLAYHVVRKPSEIFMPVSGVLDKSPAETWRDYAPLFREYATANVAPALLAALAQAEGAGNPVAHTYWRWRLTWRPFAIFAPASSAVGMYQMTDGAFAEARHYCIRRHAVTEEGCWLTALYARVIPSDAVELAAIYLDRHVAAILASRPRGAPAPTPAQLESLATLVHLCGSGPARAFARRGFRLAPGERCGDHDPAAYLARVAALARAFERLAAAEE